MGSRSSPLLVNFSLEVIPLRSKVNVKILDSKYLENGDRYEVVPWEQLHGGPTGFRLAWSDLTLDDLHWSKIRVILFDVKYVKNGNSYDVRHNVDYTECPWASLCVTLRGHGDQHVGIYASPDNWRTCIGLLFS